MRVSTNLQANRAAELIDELATAQRVLARSQAHRAEFMVEYSTVRSRCDPRFVAELEAAGCDPRYRPGEFGAMEIGAAVRESKSSVGKVLGIAGRLQAEAGRVGTRGSPAKSIRKRPDESAKPYVDWFVIDRTNC